MLVTRWKTAKNKGNIRLLPVAVGFFLNILLPKNALSAGDISSFELSPEQLFSAKIMSASKTSEKLMDAPAAIYVITNEDIKRSGATSIPEVLRMVPGVNVARINTSGWAISVRGFNSALTNKLLVLIDGREVYDPLFSGVYWDIQDTPLEDIERIEVIRGPGASLWGSNAVNGVINIITKSAFDTAANLLSVSSGNKETALATARHGGKLGDNSYYRIYEKSSYRNNQQTQAGRDANDDWRAHRTGFRADWKNDAEQSAMTLQGDAYHNQDSQMRNVTLTSSPFSQIKQENMLARGGNILWRLNKTLDNDSKITITSYVDYTSRNQALLADKRISYDLDSQYELAEWRGNQFIVGAKYRYSVDMLTQTPGELISFGQSKDISKTLSGFIQDKITLRPEKLFLTLGSKIEHNSYTGVEIQPNARLQWHPYENQMWWGAISRAVRTPSRLEDDLQAIQIATFVSGLGLITGDTIANPDLKSEKLTAYEAGYRNQLTEKLSFDIAAFYNNYTSLVTYTLQGIRVPPPRYIIPFMPINNQTAETYGSEATVNWRARDNIKLSASYSLLDMYVHGLSASASEAVEKGSPENQFNLRVLWDVTENISFDTALYYVSQLAALQVDGYTRLDMRVSWRAMDGVELSLTGQNLLDSSHREFTSPTDGHVFTTEINRSIYGNITWRF